MFSSVLFPFGNCDFVKNEPDFFRDLNLDQVLEPIFFAESDYGIQEYFYSPVSDEKTILYRQEILRDFENKDVFDLYDSFSRDIFKISSDIKAFVADYEGENRENVNLISKGHMLFYAEQYVALIRGLIQGAEGCQIKSAGLREFNDFLREYAESENFNNIIEDTCKIRAVFDEKEYCLMIKRGTFKVLKYNKEDDNCDEARELFGRFIEDDSTDYLHNFPDRLFSEHIENKILTLLQKIYPKEFGLLDKFFSSYIDFVNDTVVQFAREIRFFIGWHNFTLVMKENGLSFCYPEIVETASCQEKSSFQGVGASGDEKSEKIFSSGFFDIALAKKIKGNVVVNEFVLNEPERIIVITGPNQGGKTTFARALGQLFYFASLGLSVAGTSACLPVADKILTHFERKENFSTQRGKLQDDVDRLHDVLSCATEKSLIIVNEIYASTTLKDALKLGSFMMDDIAKLKSIAVVVTFMDELAGHGEETVSMMSNVKSDNSNERTFKIIRRPPDGNAHAEFIAEKYGLTYEQIKGRL